VVLALKLLFRNSQVVVNQATKPQQQLLLKEEAAGLDWLGLVKEEA
jgi:hypothetical protein